MTVNVQTKSRSINLTNMVVGEGGTIIMINSPFIRVSRHEPPAQLAEGQDMAASVDAGTSPGMYFSHTPHPLTLTSSDLTDHTPLNISVSR